MKIKHAASATINAITADVIAILNVNISVYPPRTMDQTGRDEDDPAVMLPDRERYDLTRNLGREIGAHGG